MVTEQWKKFEETDTQQHFISTAGRVKTVNKITGDWYYNKIGKQSSGYRNVNVAGITRYIHILVAEAFIPNPENKPTVNHLNGVDGGDALENLEWATWEEQNEHARRTGLKTSGKTPTIVLDTNGYVMSEHETTREALTSYNGRNVYYNKDVQIVGNAIIMKRSYYDSLEEYELDKICEECLKIMLEKTFLVNGKLVDGGKQTSEIVGRHHTSVVKRTKNKKSAIINGYEVSRVSNRIGIFSHNENAEGEIHYEQTRI
ncbi:HNH endonuclease [Metabacillus litoralis]|uniref:HNH endonuclease n=1 Tax=Metabacillus litoralis TaxID=152268 RepID=UPI00204163F4|nr:HNH endonuclease [Metabacillus litoralis]MCM3411871.1 HNH endonuclease [Metabacillus litoralis]